jgi:hypothetical protein
LAKHIQLRKNEGLSYYLTIIDGKEMIMGPAITDEEASERNQRELDLWTNNRMFIRGMYAFFENLWRISPLYRRTS